MLLSVLLSVLLSAAECAACGVLRAAECAACGVLRAAECAACGVLRAAVGVFRLSSIVRREIYTASWHELRTVVALCGWCV